IEVVSQVFTKFLPMQEVGLGWIFPAIIGGFIGYGISIIKIKNKLQTPTRADKKIG
ncbi:branched-chain amino acid transporter, partial [Bacillus cereus]|nr:branched-chain amino acid transporter [Bacillus cereus]